MAAKILSADLNAATLPLLKAAFDAWAVNGQVVVCIAMTANDARTQFDLLILYYA